MPSPFTILHHTGTEPEHFDLLIAFPNEPLLRTWRIHESPETWLNNPPLAARQPDHRPIYLTYEGEISNNRGRVRQVLRGDAAILSETLHACTLRLTAENFSCTLTLPLAT